MSLQTCDKTFQLNGQKNSVAESRKVSRTCCSRVLPHCSDTSTKYKTAARKWASAVIACISIVFRSSSGWSSIPGVSITFQHSQLSYFIKSNSQRQPHMTIGPHKHTAHTALQIFMSITWVGLWKQKVIQGLWQWCHSIGHIQLHIRLPLQPCLYHAPFPRYYHLFPKM